MTKAAEATARYRARHPERVRAAMKQRYPQERVAALARKDSPEGWARSAMARIRHRAKKTGLKCTITWRDIVPPLHCPVLGLPLQFTGNPTAGNRLSPSVDRFDNAEGYIPGNVRVISNRANLLKKDATLAELRCLVVYMGGVL